MATTGKTIEVKPKEFGPEDINYPVFLRVYHGEKPCYATDKIIEVVPSFCVICDLLYNFLCDYQYDEEEVRKQCEDSGITGEAHACGKEFQVGVYFPLRVEKDVYDNFTDAWNLMCELTDMDNKLEGHEPLKNSDFDLTFEVITCSISERITETWDNWKTHPLFSSIITDYNKGVLDREKWDKVAYLMILTQIMEYNAVHKFTEIMFTDYLFQKKCANDSEPIGQSMFEVRSATNCVFTDELCVYNDAMNRSLGRANLIDSQTDCYSVRLANEKFSLGFTEEQIEKYQEIANQAWNAVLKEIQDTIENAEAIERAKEELAEKFKKTRKNGDIVVEMTD